MIPIHYQSAKPPKSSIDVPYKKTSPQNPTESRARGATLITPAILPKPSVRARACGTLTIHQNQYRLISNDHLFCEGQNVRPLTVHKIQYFTPFIHGWLAITMYHSKPRKNISRLLPIFHAICTSMSGVTITGVAEFSVTTCNTTSTSTNFFIGVASFLVTRVQKHHPLL